MISTKRTIAVGIHSGASTQSQLQWITPQSFKTMKIIESSPQNPMPPDDLFGEPLDDELLDIMFLLSFFVSINKFLVHYRNNLFCNKTEKQTAVCYD